MTPPTYRLYHSGGENKKAWLTRPLITVGTQVIQIVYSLNDGVNREIALENVNVDSL